MSEDIARLGIKIDAKQVKKGTEDLKKLGIQAEKTEKRAVSMGKAFGAAFLAYGGGRLFSSVISNTIEQEKVTAQLEATLKSTGNYTEELSENLQEYASQLQKVTTFGDEAIVASEALLLTFRKIGSDVFPRAEMAVLDVATAMSIDLKSAAIQVGKALNDPATGMSALSRSGITFTQVQKDLVKGFLDTNQPAKAQNVILTELEAQFGGSAKAAKDTLGGAIISLQNSFGDLLEGDKGSTTEVISSLNELTETLNSPEVKQGFQTFVTGVFAVTNQFAKLFAFLSIKSPMEVLVEQTDDAREKFEDLLAEYNKLRILRINPFISSEGLADKVQDAKREWEDLQKQIFLSGKSLDELKTPIIDFGTGSEEALTVNKALAKTLKDVQKEAAKTSDSFKKMFEDVTKISKADSEVTTIDIANVQLQAQADLNAGDIDGAIKKAKEGFDLIQQIKDSGNLSDSLVEYYAQQFRDIGDEAGEFAVIEAQVNIDAELAKQKAIQAGEVMQEVITANPLIQIVELKWADGTDISGGRSVVPNAATSTPKQDQPQLRPTIIKIGNGSESPPMYGDQASVDEWLRKEATKRGTR